VLLAATEVSARAEDAVSGRVTMPLFSARVIAFEASAAEAVRAVTLTENSFPGFGRVKSGISTTNNRHNDTTGARMDKGFTMTPET
jgi:hypothetical protein